MENNPTTLNSGQQIFTSLVNVMKDIKAITKDQTNSFFKFKFRGIDDVYNALQPLLGQHNIFLTTDVLNIKRDETKPSKSVVITMKYNFYAKDGSSVSCISVGEGEDKNDKATSKAMAMAHKYALLQMFCIPTEDLKDSDFDDKTQQNGNKTANNNKSEEILFDELAEKINIKTKNEINYLQKFIINCSEKGNKTTKNVIVLALDDVHTAKFKLSFIEYSSGMQKSTPPLN